MSNKVNFPNPSKTMHVTTDQLKSLLWVRNEKRFAEKYSDVKELIISPGNTQNKAKVKYCDASYFPNLKKDILEEGITEIDSFAFLRSSIRSIKLPSTLKCISYAAFARSDIEDIEWPDKVNGLAIEGCSAWFAFGHCPNLKELIFPEGTSYVAVPAHLTPNLEKIHLPSSVKDLYSDGPLLAIMSLPSLKKLTWGDKVLIDVDNDITIEKERQWDDYAIKDGKLTAVITKSSYRREHWRECKERCLALLAD